MADYRDGQCPCCKKSKPVKTCERCGLPHCNQCSSRDFKWCYPCVEQYHGQSEEARAAEDQAKHENQQAEARAKTLIAARALIEADNKYQTAKLYLREAEENLRRSLTGHDGYEAIYPLIVDGYVIEVEGEGYPRKVTVRYGDTLK